MKILTHYAVEARTGIDTEWYLFSNKNEANAFCRKAKNCRIEERNVPVYQSAEEALSQFRLDVEQAIPELYTPHNEELAFILFANDLGRGQQEKLKRQLTLDQYPDMAAYCAKLFRLKQVMFNKGDNEKYLKYLSQSQWGRS